VLTERDLPVESRSDELEIDIPRRELRVNGVLVPLGGRAFDVLRALVEASGSTVTKSDLMARVWPDVVVGDTALQVQIFEVRKALGANRSLLRTVSGHGYRLLGDWVVRPSRDAVEPSGSPSRTVNPHSTRSGDSVREASPSVPASGHQPIYRSGDCEIDLVQRQLRIRGAAVPIGGRAFDIMAVLVEAANEIVTRGELLERIWPGVTVGGTAIDVHMSAIRKALGPHRAMLKSISGRGFCLIGAWTIQSSDALPPSSPPSRIGGSTNLPAAANDLVGRAAALEHLQQACSAWRIVTLTGPGGIGKTTLAIELARNLLPAFDAGVSLVELTSLADPNLVPLAVAEAIGLPSAGGPVSAEVVARRIGHNRLLLVLDNCEHLVGAAARLAETIIRTAPHAVILATSRETLRTVGEYVYRVPPLDVPPHDSDDAAEILGNSAVQLFLGRVESLRMAGLRDRQNLRLIASICRHLDGMPLAIEFAAARATSLGLSRVASGLKDRFALLTTGRRTALPRHQTLRAVLDWSYALLPEAERLLLHRLAIFSGGFVFEAACAVMNDYLPTEVADCIVNLVEKSVVNLEVSVPSGRWRLLETVRAYALDKLTSSGDYPLTARRHAEHFRDFFATFDPNADPEGGGDELPRFTREVDNLRAALNWTFSASGDSALGTALAAAAVKFWLAASLLAECCDWTSKALAQLDGMENSEPEMVLRSGRALAVLFSQGMTPAAHADLTRALAIAEARGSIEYQQRAVYGLWLFNMRSLPLRGTLALGQRYAELARSDADPAAMIMADLFIGTALTYLGEYVEAAELLERTILNYPVKRRYRELARLGIDPRASAIGHLSVCLFSRGLMDAAIRVGERAIEEARQVGHPIATSMAMAWPASLQFPGIGAFDTAERYIAALLEHADRYALETYHAIAMCAKGRLLAMRGDPRAGLAVLRPSFAQLKETGYRLFAAFFHGAFAETLAAAGHIDEGLAEVEPALRYAEQMDYMFVPELLRIHGSLIANRNPDDHPAPEQLFLRAVNVAHRQQALYWELCAAVSLAELWQPQGRRAEAYALLAPICQRFTEGLTAPVLVRANALLHATEGRD
jgi:non-specific serine/threonine protein kinase